MKREFLLGAILLMMVCRVPSAEAQQGTKTAEPSLELTLGWIKDKISLYREVSIADVRGGAMTETYEVTRADGCGLEIRHVETEEGMKVSTVYQLPLQDYSEFNATNCQMFSIFTKGSSVAYVQSIEGREGRRESSNGATDHVVIFTRRKDIDNCDLQKRVKKAFDHAAELCVAVDQKEQKGEKDQTNQKEQKKTKDKKRQKRQK